MIKFIAVFRAMVVRYYERRTVPKIQVVTTMTLNSNYYTQSNAFVCNNIINLSYCTCPWPEHTLTILFDPALNINNLLYFTEPIMKTT